MQVAVQYVVQGSIPQGKRAMKPPRTQAACHGLYAACEGGGGKLGGMGGGDGGGGDGDDGKEGEGTDGGFIRYQVDGRVDIWVRPPLSLSSNSERGAELN